jgi:hypothetical protein
MRLERGEPPAPEQTPAPVRRPADADTVLDTLLRDPSLRQTEHGRQLLRLLRQNVGTVRELTALVSVVPPHCAALVSQLAGQFARGWLELADELDERPAAPS